MMVSQLLTLLCMSMFRANLKDFVGFIFR